MEGATEFDDVWHTMGVHRLDPNELLNRKKTFEKTSAKKVVMAQDKISLPRHTSLDASPKNRAVNMIMHQHENSS